MSKQALHLAAVDLGADSGRVMLGRFDGERLTLSEAHRFASHPVRLQDGLFTDVLRVWSEILTGLAAAAARAGRRLDGIGVDTWGVDFALLDAQGSLLGNPYHYRDALADGMLDEAFWRVPRAEIFEATGIQFMQINTLYQLLGLARRRPALLGAAERLLMMPDLFGYWLTGRAVSEMTIASTSQAYDPRQKDWARPLLERLGLPTSLFGEIISPGSVLGDLRSALAEETGLGAVPVLAPGGHDTALAVAAVPAAGPDFAYVSSGTWSLLGCEVTAPVIDASTRDANFTNEGGVGGNVRLLKNLCGLWLVQESRRVWARAGKEYSHAELTEAAAQAPAFRSIVDVDAPELASPGDMPARLRDACRQTGQPVPESVGEVVRCALDSLALKYRHVLGLLESIVGRRLTPLHVVGGGSQNRLLNQLAADATGRPVVAGPAEATALGNLAMQALALGRVGSLNEARELIRRSVSPEAFEPRKAPGADAAYERLLALEER